MPSGIASGPEEYQRRQHEFLDGLNGVINIADDICVYGCGDTKEEADFDDDRNLTQLLEKCNKHDFRLSAKNNAIQVQLCLIYGVQTYQQRSAADPSKVAAITGIPTSADKAALQRFLGMCQYLSKFCQNLSQTVLPLRDLARDNTEFLWSEVHEAAFNSAKTLIASTTALRYYDVSLPVTLQVDASNSAIGGGLLQEGHPVCFTSHNLSVTEKIMLKSRKSAWQLCPVWRNGIITYMESMK